MARREGGFGMVTSLEKTEFEIEFEIEDDWGTTVEQGVGEVGTARRFA
jgi:hypothetical protein